MHDLDTDVFYNHWTIKRMWDI